MLLPFLFSASLVQAQLDASDQEALQKTQELLRNKSQRDHAIQQSPGAQQAVEFLQQLTGGDAKMSEDIFALAADVFSILVTESAGDVSKMNEALEKFKRAPAQFASKWTPEQKARLKKLAERLEKPAMAPKD